MCCSCLDQKNGRFFWTFVANLPTPIITNGLYYHGAMCITPDITSCSSVPDGTKLIYKSMPNNDCNHPYMLYEYQADGSLIHHCSKKKICPDSDGYLQVSSQCSDDGARFQRTAVCKRYLCLNFT